MKNPRNCEGYMYDLCLKAYLSINVFRKASQCSVDNEILFHYITIALCVLLRSELYNVLII